MQKTILKCDNCRNDIVSESDNKYVDKTGSSVYYEITEKSIPGWCYIDEYCGTQNMRHICRKCMEESKLVMPNKPLYPKFNPDKTPAEQGLVSMSND